MIQEAKDLWNSVLKGNAIGLNNEAAIGVMVVHDGGFKLCVSRWVFRDEETLDCLLLTLLAEPPLSILKNVDCNHERGVREILGV